MFNTDVQGKKKTPQRLKHRASWGEPWIRSTNTKELKGKGKRSALLSEKVSMAASSSWSQTELLSRPGRIPHEEQQEGKKAAKAGGG